MGMRVFRLERPAAGAEVLAAGVALVLGAGALVAAAYRLQPLKVYKAA
jgi:hypothetical protein